MNMHGTEQMMLNYQQACIDRDNYKAQRDTILDFTRMVARMKTEEEYGEETPSIEDWICTLSEVIDAARAALAELEKEGNKNATNRK